MPPKRRAAGGGGGAAAASAASATSLPKERQSKLAKEHNISARQEREIKEAFALFAEPMDGEKEGVIPIDDVRRAMVALGVPPTKPELKEFREILDPEEEGYASYEPFLAICALKLHAKEDDFEGPESDAHRQEVDEAFRLFTSPNNSSSSGGGGGGGHEQQQQPILTLAHLKRVAMTLKQDVDEALLKDMILEANSGAGVGKGVRRDEFEEVMRRAGAWK
ncbi:calmodulin [Microdochium trichocladiopsis]|uniref:Calmodulin n=1 Tax=Microdochium trichocladiopsis TaxID=1682393 RepID=A0A9P8Y972_9PEZI|nr:calmodulin [Microdochium trichocladiopsis]KAH7033288.1 calmodulin [Microdochium trichocladiopsis]